MRKLILAVVVVLLVGCGWRARQIEKDLRLLHAQKEEYAWKGLGYTWVEVYTSGRQATTLEVIDSKLRTLTIYREIKRDNDLDGYRELGFKKIIIRQDYGKPPRLTINIEKLP